MPIVRVHDLAKELGLSSKVLIERLQKLGIAASNHMSAIQGEDISKLKAAFPQLSHLNLVETQHTQKNIDFNNQSISNPSTETLNQNHESEKPVATPTREFIHAETETLNHESEKPVTTLNNESEKSLETPSRAPLHKSQSKRSQKSSQINIDPADRNLAIADSLFKASYNINQCGETQQAIDLLDKALSYCPKHSNSLNLLTDIFIDQKKTAKATELLEKLSQVDKDAAKFKEIKLLVLQADSSGDDNEKISILERVLAVTPKNPEALKKYKEILENQANIAIVDHDYERAYKLFKKANSNDMTQKVSRLIQMNDLYLLAIDAISQNQNQKAQKLLVEIISVDPCFRESSRYLHLAVTNVDVLDVIEKNQTLEIELNSLISEKFELQKQIEQLKQQIDICKYTSIEQEREALLAQMQSLEQEKVNLRNLQNKLKNMIEKNNQL